jgi:hypothetical protein
LRQKIEKEYGNTPWGKRLFDDLFRWLWFVQANSFP